MVRSGEVRLGKVRLGEVRGAAWCVVRHGAWSGVVCVVGRGVRLGEVRGAVGQGAVGRGAWWGVVCGRARCGVRLYFIALFGRDVGEKKQRRCRFENTQTAYVF